MGFSQAPALPYSKLGISEDGDTASRAISKGKYVIWKGKNYFAKTDILQGETFVEDTNLTEIPDGALNGIADALNASMIHSKKMTSSEFTYLPNGSRYKFNDQTFATRIISAFAIAISGFYTCTIRLDDAPDYYVMCFYQGGSIMSSFPSDVIVLYI